MFSKGKYLKKIAGIMICFIFLTCFSGYNLMAANEKILILNTQHTEGKIVEGDAFSATVQFCPSNMPLKITGVEVSGEAANKINYSYELTNGEGDELDGIEIGVGEITNASLKGLTYTGEGSEITVTLKYDGGSIQEKITLDTVTNADVKGALILDSSASSNMSATINAGETKKLSLQIKNASTSTVKNGKVKISFADTVLGLTLKEGQYIELANMNAKATKTVSFTVEATQAVKAGNYKINIEINDVKQVLYLQVDSSLTPPILELSIPKDKKFKLGTLNDLDITVKNIGNKAAKNIKLEIKNQKDVAILGSSNVKHITSLASNGNMSFNSQIQLDSSTSTNLILLEVGLTYYNEAGEVTTDTQYLYLNTDSLIDSKDIHIASVTGPTGTYEVNDEFTIKFTVKSNHGAENVKVSVNPPSNIILKSQSIFVVPGFKAGESKEYSVILAATEAINTGTHPIEMLLEYEYNDEKMTTHQYTSVNINNDEEDEENTNPKVIVEQYTLEPKVIQAGKNIEVTLNFLNTHHTKSIHNLVATLSTSSSESKSTSGSDTTSLGTTSINSSNIFTPVDTSGTLFIAKLLPGEAGSKNITLATLPSTTAKNYEVNVTISYEDAKGNAINTVETIAIPVQQETSIDVAQIQMGNLTVGKSASITATLYNIGKTDMSNVMIFLEGEGFTVEDNKSYLSSFSKGATEYYLPTITPTQGGTLAAELVIQYEDTLGEKQEMRHPFSLEVIEQTGGTGGMNREGRKMQAGNMSGMPQEQKTVSTGMLIGGLVAVAVAAFIIFKMFKKRKELKAFNHHD